MEAADTAAIEAESNEQAAWQAWQACLEAQEDRVMLEEIALRQAEVETELEDSAAQLELAYVERDLLEIVTGQTWIESMAECFRTTDAAREDIAELQRKLTTHGC